MSLKSGSTKSIQKIILKAKCSMHSQLLQSKLTIYKCPLPKSTGIACKILRHADLCRLGKYGKKTPNF